MLEYFIWHEEGWWVDFSCSPFIGGIFLAGLWTPNYLKQHQEKKNVHLIQGQSEISGWYPGFSFTSVFKMQLIVEAGTQDFIVKLCAQMVDNLIILIQRTFIIMTVFVPEDLVT